MIEALSLVVLSTGGVIVVGLGMMWVKTRNRTNTGNTRVAVDRFSNAANRVSSAQAKWYDLQNEAIIARGGLEGEALERLESAEREAHECSREVYDAWLPISDVEDDDVASFNDDSRAEVTQIKLAALAATDRFERKLDRLETILDELRA